MNRNRSAMTRSKHTSRKGSARPGLRNPLLEVLEQRSLLTVTNLHPVPTFTVTEGASYKGVLAIFDSSESVASDFTATSSSTLPGNPTLQVNSLGQVSPGVWEYSVSVPAGFTAGGANAPNQSQAAVTVTDTVDSTQAATTVNYQVTEASLTFFDSNPIPSATEGSPLSTFPLMRFTDGNSSAPLSDYTGTIDWGDGTPVTPASFSMFGTEVLVSGSHTYTQAGTISGGIKITVTDTGFGGGTVHGTTGVVTINDAPLSASSQAPIPINASEGQLLTGIPLGTFLDANPLATASDFTGTISWGDGSPTDVATFTLVGISGGQSEWLVTGSHTFAQAGDSPFTINVSVSDRGGQTLTGGLTTTATVIQGPLVVQATSLKATAATPVAAGQIIGSFSDNAGADALADYSATINWGDGTTDNAVIAPGVNSNTFDIQAPAAGHTYATPGLYPITISVQDADPTAGTANAFALVTPAALTAGNVPPAQTVDEGETIPSTTQVLAFTYGDASQLPSAFAATIDWGDGTPLATGTVAGAAGSYTVTGGHTYAEAGNYTVTTTVTDSYGQRIAQTSSATVNDAPLLSSGQPPIPVNASEGQLLTGIPLGTFLDANPLATAADFTGMIDWGDGSPADVATFTLVGISGGLSEWLVTGSHTYAQVAGSPFTISTCVCDKDGAMLVGGLTTTATVLQGPLTVQAMSLQATAATPVAAGQIIGSFSDNAGGDVLADYSATINWGDGTINAAVITAGVNSNTFDIQAPAVGHTYATPGLYPITIIVHDADPTAGTANAFALVTPAALTGGAVLPAQTVNEGQAIPPTTQVLAFTYGDASQLPSAFTATIDWGDGTPLATGTVAGAAGSYTVTGGHTYSEAGKYTVTITVTDPYSQHLVETSSTTVNDAPLSGSGQAPIPVNASEGQLLTGIPLGTFLDANPLATASDFTGTVNWGDGSPADVATFTLVGISGGHSEWLVTGSHTYARAAGSPFTISVSVTDKDGATLAGGLTTTATVVQGPLAVQAMSLKATAATPVAAGLVIGEFSDNGGGDALADYSATIDWGDGTTDNAVIIPGPNGNTFDIQAPAVGHTYATPGLYPITIIVHDADPTNGTANTFALVSPAALTAGKILPAQTVDEGQTIPSSTQLMSFTYGDPSRVPSDFAATIDWGDGTPLATGTITGSNGSYAVTGGHTYAEAGNYTATITVTDPYGQSLIETSSTTVKDAPLSGSGHAPIPVNASEGQLLTGIPLGTFLDANPLATASDFTGTVNWGDGSPADVATFTLVGISGGHSEWLVTGSHTFAKAAGSPFTINVSVTDKDGATLAGGLTTTATVLQGPLAVQATSLKATAATPVAAGQIIGSFSDNAGGDALGGYSATINWGDGTTDAATIVVGPNSNTFDIQAPAAGHTYATPGLYPITIIVHDADPTTGTANAFALVTPAALTGGAVLPAQTVNEGQAIPPTTQVLAFTYGDASQLPSAFAATIDWGDGTPLATGTVAGSNGSYKVTGGHTYAEAGNYTVTITVTDPYGQRAVATSSATVNDAPLSNATGVNVNATVYQPVNDVLLATFVDANALGSAGDFTATINWGDGTALDTNARVALLGASPNGTGLRYGVYGSHVFTHVTPAGSPFQAQVTVNDDDGNTISTAPAAISVSVAASPLAISPVPINAVEGVPLPNGQTITTPNGANPPTIVATFSNTGASDPLSAYSATIDWGNGSGSTPDTVTTATILQTGNTFVILAPASASVTYPEEGNYTVRVTLTDSNGSTTVYALDQVTVADGRLSPASTQPTIPAQTQGTATGLIPLVAFNDQNPLAPSGDFTATIDWGDGTPQSAGLVSQPGGAGTAFVVSGNHTYAQPSTGGGYTILVHVIDQGGSSATLTAMATVSASTITVTPTTFNAVEGQPVANVLLATFTDTGLAGPLSSYAASITWNDRASSTVTPGQIVPLGGNQFAVLGNLPNGYPEEGTYAVSLTISHNGAAVAGSPFTASANVADASLQGTASPIAIAAQAAYTGPIAHFTDLDPNGTPSDYTVTVDWGDGSTVATLQGSAVISQPAGAGTPFVVNAGSPGHVYNQPGTYVLTVTVTDHNATFTANSVVTVATAINPAPLAVKGQLDPASDSGRYNNDGITNVSEPAFFGTTGPNAAVKLYATPVGNAGGTVLIGQTTALADGSWRITSNHLADGAYVITATATAQQSNGTSTPPVPALLDVATATGSPVLVVDTMGPRVTGVSFDRSSGTVTLTFQDFGPAPSGLLPQSLQDAANYAFNNQRARPLGRYIVGAITDTPGAGTGPQTVTLSVVSTHLGQPLSSRLLRGFFQVVARAASTLKPSGIQDVAGNALDGEYYGPGSVSGNGVPGGNFVANFNNYHDITNPPATVIGAPHPNNPVSTFRKTLKPASATVHHQSVPQPHHHTAAKLASRHRG